MKYVWMMMLLLVLAVKPYKASAQAEIYGGFSDARMTNLVTSYMIPGYTVGVNIDGVRVFRRLQFGADIQGRLLNKSNVKLDSAAVGPRVSVNLSHGWSPYGTFLVGFGRYYNNGSNGDTLTTTTDNLIELNVGISKRIAPRFDVYGECSYTQFYALGGEYNPKVFSGGLIFHFAKRQ